MRTRLLIALGLALAIGIAMAGNAISGAAFTTFNPWVEGLFKGVCKNSIIDCNLYGAKPDIWLNSGQGGRDAIRKCLPYFPPPECARKEVKSRKADWGL